ncbi:MAG: sensor histidine kinase [Stackebrandtia sp.]
MRQARDIDSDLRDGLHGRGAAAAARRIRTLLDVDAAVLTDLDAPVAQDGTLPDGCDVESLTAAVCQRAAAVSQPPLIGAPLLVAGELAGCLAVCCERDPVSGADLREVAELVSESLDHARLRQARDRIAAADLRTLRAQISPHFMHNALAAISAHIRTDPDRARQLLSDFADYLRYSFSGAGDYATLADELQAVQTYLELQRARFDDRLEITVRIAPEVLPVAVPFLVVQPIVENAVRHGFERKSGVGHISVSGFGEGPLCVIEIDDDGAGMDPELARAILAGAGPPAKGVGLANVDHRLRAVYGPEHGLVVETAPDAGTKVTIRVPRFMRGVVT